MSRKSTGAGISSSGAFSLDIFNDNSLRMLINTVTVLCLPFLPLTRDHHILSEGNKDSYWWIQSISESHIPYIATRKRSHCVLSKSQPICCYNPTSRVYDVSSFSAFLWDLLHLYRDKCLKTLPSEYPSQVRVPFTTAIGTGTKRPYLSK